MVGCFRVRVVERLISFSHMPEQRAVDLIRPGDESWEKCARHTNPSTTRYVANLFLCDECAARLRSEAFNGRAPLFDGLHVEGYCGLCNRLGPTGLRQWFVCPICLNVVLSYPKGFAASRFVVEYWNRNIAPAFPDLVIEELDEIRLEPFVPLRRGAKAKALRRQPLDFRVSRRGATSLDPLFCVELKAGPAAVEEMREFQLDVNDFNDIANGCSAQALPAYVFHVQITDEYLPPTRRSVGRDLWWTDIWTLDEARKAVRKRRGEDKWAGYYKPSAFRKGEAFVEELRNHGYADLAKRLAANGIPLMSTS